MCQLHGVTRSGYYAWRLRAPSARNHSDAALSQQVQRIHSDSRGLYGAPRVWAQLGHEGVKVSQGRVARLMRNARLQGRSTRTGKRSRAGLRRFFTSIPNRERESDQPLARLNQVWVGDVTYLKVAGQWRYLAVVMDKHSRRIVGWSVSSVRDTALTLQALNHAVRNRKPARGLIFHSDRGSEYAAHDYRKRLSKLGFVQSMNRPGHMNDNAHMESFFHSMKTEELSLRKFSCDDSLHETLLSYIQFYNQQRLHSSIGYRSPAGFEKVQ
jgi:transposase InsO family protein